MNIEIIRDELNQGVSINTVCNKYNISFQELVEKSFKGSMIKPYIPRKQEYKTENAGKYIQKVNNTYILRKKLPSKTVHFGTYNTLEDAKKVRDYCIQHGWKKNCLNKYCRILGVERRRGRK